MRRNTLFTLPMIFLLFSGCADQATAPEVDLTATFKKPPKPPPTADPANPVIAYYDGGLWVADEDGSNKTKLYDPTGIGLMPAWSPLGEGTALDPYEILLTGPLVPTVERMRFFVDGGPPQLLDVETVNTTTVNYQSVVVSPDGQSVVGTTFYSEEWGGLDPLLLTDPTFATERIIYHAGPDGSIRNLTWSGDGSKVAFFDYPWDGELVLKIIDIPGPLDPLSEPIVVWTFPEGYSEGMSWAPHSDRLVFNVDDTMYLLELQEVEGKLEAKGSPEPLGPGRGPVWSPEGERILYYNRHFFIKTLGSDGKDQRLRAGGRFQDWRRDPPQ